MTTLALVIQQVQPEHTTAIDSTLLSVIIGVASAALFMLVRSFFDRLKSNREELVRHEAQSREDIAVLAEEQEQIKKNYNDKFQRVYDKQDDMKATLSREIAQLMVELKNLALVASESYIKRGECPFYQDPEGYMKTHARSRAVHPPVFNQGETS